MNSNIPEMFEIADLLNSLVQNNQNAIFVYHSISNESGNNLELQRNASHTQQLNQLFKLLQSLNFQLWNYLHEIQNNCSYMFPSIQGFLYPDQTLETLSYYEDVLLKFYATALSAELPENLKKSFARIRKNEMKQLQQLEHLIIQKRFWCENG
jgi:hypothetical protein